MKKTFTILTIALVFLTTSLAFGDGTPRNAFGFNGTVSGFPSGEVFVTGGGAFNLATGFVHSSGGFSCLRDVLQGPLSVSINTDDPGQCLADQGVRWDTAELLASTNFKCTGAATESPKSAATSDTTVVLQADFYRAGDGIDESFTAQMIVSAVDIDPGTPGVQNLWVQGVGCGTAIVHFSNSSAQRDVPLQVATPVRTRGGANPVLAAQGTTNGVAGQRPAYYDGELFTINMKELSGGVASDSTIENNRSHNVIYASNDLDEEQDFFSVIDAIQGDGFNPLWRQVLIVFNPGFPPHQFFSDDEIDEAAAGANPEITLVETDEMYRCSVVGRN